MDEFNSKCLYLPTGALFFVLAVVYTIATRQESVVQIDEYVFLRQSLGAANKIHSVIRRIEMG